ncbi:hypothetical protein L210DRAFT_3531668 [Boletus edulis BED1]|uniref:Uncharacterized protein n=1 Tax=Boletus edulis BED1 TaxID=1328754 RepID=A0AAD4C1D2_BOLED|nr:hypothetical protein L210DRAFT_3531668 [Boletus edulis BED1]
MGDRFSSVVVALLRTTSLSASITPSCRQNQLSSGCHEIPFIYPRMYHTILLRMRWNKGMGGVLSNGWNEELVKALHTFEADGTDSCLITHVRPDRYDEGVFQQRCLNSGAAN